MSTTNMKLGWRKPWYMCKECQDWYGADDSNGEELLSFKPPCKCNHALHKPKRKLTIFKLNVDLCANKTGWYKGHTEMVVYNNERQRFLRVCLPPGEYRIRNQEVNFSQPSFVMVDTYHEEFIYARFVEK